MQSRYLPRDIGHRVLLSNLGRWEILCLVALRVSDVVLCDKSKRAAWPAHKDCERLRLPRRQLALIRLPCIGFPLMPLLTSRPHGRSGSRSPSRFR